MGDDGAIKVTLPFTFTYYNQQFTDTWMYDNGIISFLQPGSSGSLSPWQWYAQPFNQVNANYYIASLWADIAPVSATKYITSTDGTYMKYTWQDIAEYYSAWGNWRLNTFSTTLKNDGTIETHYTNINLQTSAIGVGTVGNISAGEYNQIYYSSCCTATTTSMIPDWTIAGVPPPPPPPEPVVVQPEPVYVAPVIEEVIEPTPVVVVNEPAAQTAPIVSNTVSAVVQAATESSPGSVTTASIVATTSTSETSNKMSAADAQAIARTNQRNANQLAMSVVNSSIESSTVQSISTDSDASSTTDSSSSSSSTQSSTSSVNAMGQSTGSYGDTFNPVATNATSLANFSRLPGSFNNDVASETQTTSVMVENTETTDNNKPATAVTEIVAVIADETNPTSVRSLAANNAIKQMEQEEEKEKKTIEIVDMARDSSLSELNNSGILLTELQVLPIGYNIYLSTVLKDAAFYAPKAIYRNQTVVDNAPVQRLLKFASDAKFDQMVSQQYGEQK